MENNIGLEKHTAMRMINVEQISDYMVCLFKELVSQTVTVGEWGN